VIVFGTPSILEPPTFESQQASSASINEPLTTEVSLPGAPHASGSAWPDADNRRFRMIDLKLNEGPLNNSVPAPGILWLTNAYLEPAIGSGGSSAVSARTQIRDIGNARLSCIENHYPTFSR
jgi:hypothetical protein